MARPERHASRKTSTAASRSAGRSCDRSVRLRANPRLARRSTRNGESAGVASIDSRRAAIAASRSAGSRVRRYRASRPLPMSSRYLGRREPRPGSRRTPPGTPRSTPRDRRALLGVVAVAQALSEVREEPRSFGGTGWDSPNRLLEEGDRGLEVFGGARARERSRREVARLLSRRGRTGSSAGVASTISSKIAITASRSAIDPVRP